MAVLVMNMDIQQNIRPKLISTVRFKHMPPTTTRRYRRRVRRPAPPPVGLFVFGLCAVAMAFVVWVYAQDHRPPAVAVVPVAELVSSPPRPVSAAIFPPSEIPSPSRPEPVTQAVSTPPQQPPPAKREAPATQAPAPRPDANASVPPWQPMTPVALSRVRHVASAKPATLATGSFTLPTTMPDLPEVVCDWCIPLADDGVPLASAVDLVCLFPYPTEQQAIRGLGSVLHRHWGFTTLSIRFPGMGSIDGNDRRRFYYYPESGSGAAWLEAIRRVRQIGVFPDRPVYVTGRSGGGSAAGLFADANPDLVAAVANEAGRVFAQPPRFTGPVLLMHGHHDYVVPVVDSYLAQVNGSYLTRFTFPPSWSQRGRSQIWQHGINGPAERAMWSWLAGVANLGLAHGVIPPRALWPAQFNNITLPNDETAALFAEIPNPYRVLKYNDKTDGAVAIARPLGTPRGIIALIGNDFASDFEELAMDAEFLSNSGWLAIAVRGEGHQLTSGLHSALADKELLGTQHLPWMLVMDSPDILAELMQVRPVKLVGATLCTARVSLVHRALAILNKAQLPLTVVGSVDHVTTCRLVNWPKPEPIWLSVRCANQGDWHRERRISIRAQAQSLIPAKDTP